MHRHLSIGLLISTTLLATPAAAVNQALAGLQAMRELNLIVLNDLTIQGGEVEGKAFVGRNVSGSSSQIGIGSSANGQRFTASARATLSVGGNVAQNLNINNGANGAGGPRVGDFGGQNVYGVAIQGNVPGINFNSTGGTARIGGDVTNNLNVGAGTTLNVTGSLQNGVNLSDNVTLRVGGSVNGNINGGQNTSVSVRGNVGNLGFGSGGNATIGGNLGQLSGSNNQSVSVAGNIGQGNAGGNSTIKAGGSISNFNGSSGVFVYAGGSISGNANGGSFNSLYSFNNVVPAPIVPGAPAAPAITSEAAILSANVRALSNTLASLTIASNPSSISVTGQNQTAFFNAVNNGAGFALFEINGPSFFNKQEFSYNFPNTTLPVVINVRNIGNTSLTITTNFINNARAHNQQVIWNFVDATSITIDRMFHGSLLAPLANVQAKLMEGSVVANNYTMQDEVHLGTYQGSGVIVPEPASWMLLIAGFGLVGASLRRRRLLLTA
ncbi:MAG: choice-of-anchor A family protein [Alphaproteobacteria bacterium]|nr:choice-of-anchor A family protein [Alphaproteobacteria bacterium]